VPRGIFVDLSVVLRDLLFPWECGESLLVSFWACVDRCLPAWAGSCPGG
jgi:hypothetical protein